MLDLPTSSSLLHQVGDFYVSAKVWVLTMAEVNQHTLHVLTGLFLLFLLAALLSTSVRRVSPLIALLMVQLGIEWVDWQVDVLPDRAEQWREAVSCVILTILAPTAVMLIARWRPQLLCPGSSPTC